MVQLAGLELLGLDSSCGKFQLSNRLNRNIFHIVLNMSSRGPDTTLGLNWGPEVCIQLVPPLLAALSPKLGLIIHCHPQAVRYVLPYILLISNVSPIPFLRSAKMKLNASAHWRAPGRMLVGLLVGMLLAVGHPLSYSSLHRRAASASALGNSRISTQEANNAVGIGFAFLVKIALVYAVSVAVTQAFWRENTAKCREDAPTLARLDAMSSVLRNLWRLFDIRLSRSSPWLLLLASAAW
jgi:hypothetical protein